MSLDSCSEQLIERIVWLSKGHDVLKLRLAGSKALATKLELASLDLNFDSPYRPNAAFSFPKARSLTLCIDPWSIQRSTVLAYIPEEGHKLLSKLHLTGPDVLHLLDARNPSNRLNVLLPSLNSLSLIDLRAHLTDTMIVEAGRLNLRHLALSTSYMSHTLSYEFIRQVLKEGLESLSIFAEIGYREPRQPYEDEEYDSLEEDGPPVAESSSTPAVPSDPSSTPRIPSSNAGKSSVNPSEEEKEWALVLPSTLTHLSLNMVYYPILNSILPSPNLKTLHLSCTDLRPTNAPFPCKTQFLMNRLPPSLQSLSLAYCFTKLFSGRPFETSFPMRLEHLKLKMPEEEADELLKDLSQGASLPSSLKTILLEGAYCDDVNENPELLKKAENCCPRLESITVGNGSWHRKVA